MRKLTTAAAALAFAAALQAAPASAQGLQAGQTYGDWGVQCPENNNGKCFLLQQVHNKENNQPVLQARVGKITEQGQEKVRLMLIGPLGVMLPPGVAVQVDENEGHRVPFLQCTQMGCQTLITLSDKDIAELKAGTTMKVGMTPPNGQLTVIPVSLKGFTAAMDALQN